MYFLKEYKSVICILLIAIFVFSFSTIVTSATIDNMDSFTDLEENIDKKNEYEDIKTLDDDKKEENSAGEKNQENKNNVDEDETKNDIKSEIKQENVKVEEQNTSTNSLSKAGIEDTPGILIIALFVIASVYAYIKTKKY